MSRRARIAGFGLAAVLSTAGILSVIFVEGLTGEVLLLALLGTGLGIALLLVFFEVGLSEDRAREEEQQRRADASRRPQHRGSTRR